MFLKQKYTNDKVISDNDFDNGLRLRLHISDKSRYIGNVSNMAFNPMLENPEGIISHLSEWNAFFSQPCVKLRRLRAVVFCFDRDL